MMGFASVTHRSTTTNASVTINVLNQGTDDQTITIAYEEYTRDMSKLVTRRLMRLSKEETEMLAHALVRPASETCRSCSHLKKLEDGNLYCDGHTDGRGVLVYNKVNYPDTPSCREYRRATE